MIEYIEREVAIEVAKRSHLYFDFKSIINSIPAADARPVVRANWKRIDFKPCGYDYECSLCGWKNDMKTNFCPHCGADMRRV